MDYQSFKDKWLGQKVDYDHVYGYQCVDLILEYVYECYNLPTGIWGNAIDYWNNPSQPLLGKFDRFQTTDCKQGDIVVLNGLPGNPYGHIGICDSQTGTVVRLLEQNGAGYGKGTGLDAIGVHRDIAKTRIAGVLRPKEPASVPVNTPSNNAQTVTLPASVDTWRAYRVGSSLRPNTSDQVAVLTPKAFGGLTYKVEAWVGDYAVVITTQMFGRVTIWVKNTDAQIK